MRPHAALATVMIAASPLGEHVVSLSGLTGRAFFGGVADRERVRGVIARAR